MDISKPRFVKSAIQIGLLAIGLLGLFMWWTGLYRPFLSSYILFFVPSVLLALWCLRHMILSAEPRRSALYGKPGNSFAKVMAFGGAFLACYLFLSFFIGGLINDVIGEKHVRSAQLVTWMDESYGRRRHRGICKRVRAIIEHPGESMQLYQCLRNGKYRFDLGGDLPKVHVRTVESFLGYYVEPDVYFSLAPK